MHSFLSLGLRFNGATGMSYYAQGATLMAVPIVAMMRGELTVPVIYDTLKYSARLCVWCQKPNVAIPGVCEGWEQDPARSIYCSKRCNWNAHQPNRRQLAGYQAPFMA
jgi:hypothetical protein